MTNTNLYAPAAVWNAYTPLLYSAVLVLVENEAFWYGAITMSRTLVIVPVR